MTTVAANETLVPPNFKTIQGFAFDTASQATARTHRNKREASCCGYFVR